MLYIYLEFDVGFAIIVKDSEGFWLDKKGNFVVRRY